MNDSLQLPRQPVPINRFRFDGQKTDEVFDNLKKVYQYTSEYMQGFLDGIKFALKSKEDWSQEEIVDLLMGFYSKHDNEFPDLIHHMRQELDLIVLSMGKTLSIWDKGDVMQIRMSYIAEYILKGMGYIE